MALLHTQFFSETLGMSVAADVILPQASQRQIGMTSVVQNGKTPVLWLLHGASDNHTTWQRRSSIERYVSSYGYAVIMPNAHLSRYTDMAHGGKYFSYIADELPRIMREFFPMLSHEQEDNFIAGLSMGGYGSMKIGLSRPHQYAAIGCLSGGNLVSAAKDNPRMSKMQCLTFGIEPGQDAFGTKHDLLTLLPQAVQAGGTLPRIYQACGTEDFLYDSSATIRDAIKALPNDPFGYQYVERPGVHEWGFWDEEIQEFLRFTQKSK